MRTALALAACLLLASGCVESAALDPAGFPFERYLLADRVPRLVLAIHHSPGWAPSALTTEGIVEQVRLATGRSMIEVEQAPLKATAGEDGVWTLPELSQAMLEVSWQGDADAGTMHVLFLDGQYENEFVAGMAFLVHAFVFTESFAYLAGEDPTGLQTLRVPNPDHDALERAAAVHEIGHLLGLVDRFVPRNHGPVYEDGEHSGDRASVMYPAIDNVGLLGLDPEQISYRFTEDDLADVRDYQASRGFRR